MIKLSCNNDLLFINLINFLEEKNVFIANQHKYFIKVDVIEKKEGIYLLINKQIKLFKLPLNINNFFSYFFTIIKNENFSFFGLKYFPYQNLITKDKKKSFLTNIQNLIFFYLSIYDNGFDKENLYKIIWKKDKNISINKLDTHLTNLKNHLKNDLNFSINFHSNNKNIKLIIN